MAKFRTQWYDVNSPTENFSTTADKDKTLRQTLNVLYFSQNSKLFNTEQCLQLVLLTYFLQYMLT